MKFIIARSKWLRGEGAQKSRLFRESDGKMCCVGQMCVQLGQSIETLSDVSVARDIVDRTDTVKETFIDTNWVNDAYIFNDATCTDDDERERNLKSLLKDNGHEIEFIDGGVA